MAGIYIHIPFCKQKCSYCNFHFSVSLRTKDDVLRAIQKEIAHKKDYLTYSKISSIYFGGGTPSILNSSEIGSILEAIRNQYEVAIDAEISIEVNPDDLMGEKLGELKQIGFNRLSIGIQSFDDADLKIMNRAHNAKESIESVLKAQAIGFDNISIDLIYGTPMMSEKEWQSNIQQALDLNIQHISAYALTVEPKTELQHQVNKGLINMPSQELVSDQFLKMVQILSSAGFEQYEVSNFSLSGFHSKHNSSYWKSIPYIGLGPSAHSYDGKSRQWNIASNVKYAEAFKEGHDYFEKEEIEPNTAFNEYVMLGLRTKWGIDLDYIQKNFNLDILSNTVWMNNYANELMILNRTIVLNDNGLLKADKIASDLMIVD